MNRFKHFLTLVSLVFILTLVRQYDDTAQIAPHSISNFDRSEIRQEPGINMKSLKFNFQPVPEEHSEQELPERFHEEKGSDRREIDQSADRYNPITKPIQELPIDRVSENTLIDVAEIPSTKPVMDTVVLAILDIRPMNDETEIVFINKNETSFACGQLVRFEITGNDHLLPIDLLIHSTNSEGRPSHYYLDWNEQNPNEFDLYAEDQIQEGTIHILYKQESLAEFDLNHFQQRGIIVLEVENVLEHKERLLSYAKQERL